MAEVDVSSWVGAVVIGRNEGSRLLRALDSVLPRCRAVAYVDSGSTDGSPVAAAERGAEVVNLDMSKPFSAGRGRNAGWRRLLDLYPGLRYLQFLDGDMEVVEGWLESATAALEADPSVVAVCGYRRERHPERSIYNRICDVEWRVGEPGEVPSFGGDVVIRASALRGVEGYNPELIGAEDDELAVRLRQAGGRILRIDAQATIHDAAMYRIGQWWQRAKRCGYAYAQVSALHGSPPERYFVFERQRVWLWGFFVPLVAIAGAFSTQGLSLLLLVLYPLQALRVARSTASRGFECAESLAWGISCAASKFPQLAGVARYSADRLRNRGPRIIEHKVATDE